MGIGSRNRLIKLPIMQLAYREPNAKYITLNMPQELYIPEEIAEKSVGIAGDIAQSLKELNPNRSLENDKKLFLMTAIRKTALYMLDS